MKAIVLTLSCSLLAASMVGMLRGGSAEPARFEAGTDTTVQELPARIERHEVVSVGGSRSSSTADWLPEPTPGRVLAADETVRVIPLDVWRASLVMSDANRYDLLRACYCESRWQTDVVGLAGEQGACQVMARFHGPVPSDLAGQFAQADRIATAHGMTPWTTKGGCPEWNAS